MERHQVSEALVEEHSTVNLARGNSIRSVVRQHLCHGCGTCVAACPQNAVITHETASGFLVPQIGDDCTGCGICGDACPGSHLPQSLMDQCEDPFRGPVLGAYLARASNNEFLRNGQSGGAVTAILAHLLGTGQCDGALVTGPVAADARPKPFVALTRKELHLAQGSKYCPVALNAALRIERFKKLERPAIVALPCHVHGIRCLQTLSDGHISCTPLVLGLICSGIYSFHLIDHLKRATGIEDIDRSFLGLKYKDKGSYGWPGDISVYSDERGTIRVPARVRHLAKSAFRPPRCYLCFDQMNVLSDISFGDPWGIRNERDGWTVLLTRSERGQNAFDAAHSTGALIAERIEPEAVFAGQTIDSRHRPEWMLATAVWSEMGYTPPLFGFNKPFPNEPDRRARYFRRHLEYSVAFVNSLDRVKAIRMAEGRIRKAVIRRTLASPLRLFHSVARRIKRSLQYACRRVGLQILAAIL